MVAHDFSKCLTCLKVAHDVSQCLVMSHCGSWCLMASQVAHDISKYLMMSQNVWLCLIMPHDVLWCLMMFHDVSQYGHRMEYWNNGISFNYQKWNGLNFANTAFSTVALQQELKSAMTFNLYEGWGVGQGHMHSDIWWCNIQQTDLILCTATHPYLS